MNIKLNKPLLIALSPLLLLIMGTLLTLMFSLAIVAIPFMAIFLHYKEKQIKNKGEGQWQ